MSESIISLHEEGDGAHSSPFEQIRHKTDDGSSRGEYWSARELARTLGYTEFGKFRNAIQKAGVTKRVAASHCGVWDCEG